MANGLDDIAHVDIVQDAQRSCAKINLRLFDRKHILALGDAIRSKAKLAGLERIQFGRLRRTDNFAEVQTTTKA